MAPPQVLLNAQYGIKLGILLGGGRTIFDSNGVIVTQDATSGKYIPQTTAEWNALGVTSPNAIYGFQDASGNIVDSVGTATLTVTGAGATYQTAVAGWTSKSVSVGNAATWLAATTDASLPDTSTTSFMCILYIKMATVTSSRAILGIGSGAAANRPGVLSRFGGPIATPAFSLVAQGPLGANANTGVINYDPQNQATQSVIACVYKHDVSRGVDILYTDTDMIVGPIVLAGAAGKQFALGNTSTQGVSAGVYNILYCAAWYGSAAEMSDAQVQTMITSLGFQANWTATGTTGVAIDATSNIMVPNDITQWYKVTRAAGITNLGPPNSLYLCQEAAGNLTDTLAVGSTATLTAANTPTYNNAVTGWSRLSVNFVDGGLQKFTGTVGQPLLSANSILFIGYVSVGPVMAAGPRSCILLGTATAQGGNFGVGTANIQAKSGAGAAVNGSVVVINKVFPYVVRYDKTAGTLTVYSDAEKVQVGSFTAGTTGGLYLGGQSSAFGGGFLYAAQFTGKAAEIGDAGVRTLLQTLGWTVAW